MRPIPLLAEEGAERERDSAKPQEWLRHQKNAAKPQRRRRRARSASAIARSRNSGPFGWPFEGAPNRPPRPRQIGTDPFLDVADTPALRGGEWRAEKLCPKN